MSNSTRLSTKRAADIDRKRRPRIKRFLKSITQTGRLIESCDRAGFDFGIHERLCQTSQAYRRAFAGAYQRYCEKIEREIQFRAIRGRRDDGRNRSDALLMVMARALMPHKYGTMMDRIGYQHGLAPAAPRRIESVVVDANELKRLARIQALRADSGGNGGEYLADAAGSAGGNGKTA